MVVDAVYACSRLLGLSGMPMLGSSGRLGGEAASVVLTTAWIWVEAAEWLRLHSEYRERPPQHTIRTSNARRGVKELLRKANANWEVVEKPLDEGNS